MGIRTSLLCMLALVSWVGLSLPIQADDLLLDDEFDTEAIFDDSEFGLDNTDLLLQESPYQWQLKQGLVLDPKATQDPTNSYSNLHLTAETTLGLSGFANIDLKATQDWLTGQWDTEIYSSAIQISTQQGAFKLGRYINSWGEVEGAGVLDIINPAPGLTDPNRGFKPQWLVAYSHYMGPREWQLLTNLDPDIAQFPDLSATKQASREWGLRYKVANSGSDWAVYAGQFLQNSPTLGLVNSLEQLTAFEYDLLGFSYNQARGDNLFKFDLAWKQGLGQQVGNDLTQVERLDMALGAEIKVGERQWQWSLSGNYLPEHTHEFSSVIIDPLTFELSLLPSSQWSSQYGMGVSDSFANGEFNWSLNLTGALNGSMTGLISELKWDYNDNLNILFTLAGITANADSELAAMDGLQRVGIELEYHF